VTERRGADRSPVSAAVYGEVEAGAVPADEGVIHSGDEISWVAGVGDDVLFRLPAKRAVLVHPDVAPQVAVGASDRGHGETAMGRPGPCLRHRLTAGKQNGAPSGQERHPLRTTGDLDIGWFERAGHDALGNAWLSAGGCGREGGGHRDCCDEAAPQQNALLHVSPFSEADDGAANSAPARRRVGACRAHHRFDGCLGGCARHRPGGDRGSLRHKPTPPRLTLVRDTARRAIPTPRSGNADHRRSATLASAARRDKGLMGRIPLTTGRSSGPPRRSTVQPDPPTLIL